MCGFVQFVDVNLLKQLTQGKILFLFLLIYFTEIYPGPTHTHTSLLPI